MKPPGRRTLLRSALGACLAGFGVCAALASAPVQDPEAASPMRVQAAPEPAPPPKAEAPSMPEAGASELQPLEPQPEQPIGTPPRSQVVTVNYDITVPGTGQDEAPGKAQDGESAAVLERGTASWYGLQFHRRKTASGERFDMDAFTAAHRTLPFGTRVCVRSLVNGREVLVRINDRGPFAPGRIIDLSRAAADAIGLTGLGIKEVALSIVDGENTRCGAKPAAPSPAQPAPGR